ncbi:MAG: putative DNA binding domain-containing protein [Bacilli bacterium]|nr:putative DNA binding domain-containing protein [Bacilli bacterium]
MKKENQKLEFKEKLTKSYLKTVSAFANYFDGEIIFGIDDNGIVKGLDDLKGTALSLENQINDSIKPKPDYLITVNNKNKTISILVKKGNACPYKYNDKAYKRNDTSTVEVDEIELRRLYTEGANKSFDEISINSSTDLSFNVLKKELTNILKIKKINIDVLKSLNLFSNGKYNNAAALLSDSNNFAGLDIAIFGNNNNEIKKRKTLSHISLISQYYDAIHLFEETYIYEEIDGATRVKKEAIPLKAFREALANAIVHRLYDLNINTKVSFYSDKVVINSPGGLLYGISKEDYLRGSFSLLRNPIVGNVFNRLNIIEAFATGIKRINECYNSSNSKPIFNIGDNYISVTLPSYKEAILTISEKKIFDLFRSNIAYSRDELQKLCGYEKSKLIRTLNSLINKKLILKDGKNKSTVYRKI